jgi:hypothetical protein
MLRCLVNLNSISIVSFECKVLLITHSSCLQVIGRSTKHDNTFPSYYKHYCGSCCWPKCAPITNEGNSTCEHCFTMFVSIFWTTKYERKSCLNWMVSLKVLPCSQLIFPSKNLVFWNLFEFSAAEITSKSISLTFWIQILPNEFH